MSREIVDILFENPVVDRFSGNAMPNVFQIVIRFNQTGFIFRSHALFYPGNPGRLRDSFMRIRSCPPNANLLHYQMPFYWERSLFVECSGFHGQLLSYLRPGVDVHGLLKVGQGISDFSDRGIQLMRSLLDAIYVVHSGGGSIGQLDLVFISIDVNNNPVVKVGSYQAGDEVSQAEDRTAIGKTIEGFVSSACQGSNFEEISDFIKVLKVTSWQGIRLLIKHPALWSALIKVKSFTDTYKKMDPILTLAASTSTSATSATASTSTLATSATASTAASLATSATASTASTSASTTATSRMSDIVKALENNYGKGDAWCNGPEVQFMLNGSYSASRKINSSKLTVSQKFRGDPSNLIVTLRHLFSHLEEEGKVDVLLKQMKQDLSINDNIGLERVARSTYPLFHIDMKKIFAQHGVYFPLGA